MSTNDITAPGRSALWTEAALRALTGAATKGSIAFDGEVRCAMRLADAFEAACLKQHAEKQAAAKAEREVQLAEDIATVERTRRYRILWADVPHVLTVARIKGRKVYFEAVAAVANGVELHADIDDVVGGEGFEPVGAEESTL